MFRKLFTAFIVLPVGILLIVLAVANRQLVPVSLDPFGSGQAGLTANLPLFVLLMAALFVGVILGGLAAWLSGGKWRQDARRSSAQVRALRIERDALRARLAEREAEAAQAAERERERRTVVAPLSGGAPVAVAGPVREVPGLPAPLQHA